MHVSDDSFLLVQIAFERSTGSGRGTLPFKLPVSARNLRGVAEMIAKNDPTIQISRLFVSGEK